MSIVETLLVYAVIPGAAFVLLAVITMAKRGKRPGRYKPGEAWDHEPLWWTANPGGLEHGEVGRPGTGARAVTGSADVVGGGARGTW